MTNFRKMWNLLMMMVDTFALKKGNQPCVWKIVVDRNDQSLCLVNATVTLEHVRTTFPKLYKTS